MGCFGDGVAVGGGVLRRLYALRRVGRSDLIDIAPAAAFGRVKGRSVTPLVPDRGGR
jgi:hypothetical protein